MDVPGNAGGPHWDIVSLIPGWTSQTCSLAGGIQLGPRTSLANQEGKKREFKHPSLPFFKQMPEGGKVWLPLFFLPHAQSTYSQGNSSISQRQVTFPQQRSFAKESQGVCSPGTVL